MAVYLSENDVKSLLTVELAMEGVAAAHRALSEGNAVDIPRARTRLPQTALHILQGAIESEGIIGYKAYTSNRSGNRFLVHVFDAATGILRGVVSADYLGMMRTGAASGVATQVLARADAKWAGIFGAGWQAEGHIQALCAARPLLGVKVFSRRKDKLANFCARMTEMTGVDVSPAASPEALVREADVLGTITTAADPLFETEWLKSGAHINAAGSNALIRRELSEKTLRLAGLICVDTVPTALAEAGDLLPLLEKGRLQPRHLVELGDVLINRHSGRTDAAMLTVFESQGLAVQDLAVANRLLLLAEQKNIGTVWGGSA